jgi:hypothetical protein
VSVPTRLSSPEPYASATGYSKRGSKEPLCASGACAFAAFRISELLAFLTVDLAALGASPLDPAATAPSSTKRPRYSA